ncbi:co-chaperone GroES [Hymenobacter sp. ASUV-10]|uniref:Co-chaperonin GroES n=1 Tax=Hymenobacter aranciens TaxID=3063996 RepID=A0ABT9BG13_9BACT|nr:co-chaperone GroES [Hymenobacter sp. ASUV-10]MDO7875967.1 co-chaperone GroES [Hymenobacter sp. ASUV-10]
MALSIKPLADQVIIKPAVAEEKTKSGIIIPDTAKEKPQRGEVVAVGDGKVSEYTGNVIAPRVKVGDVVIYKKYTGLEMPFEGEDYIVLAEKDLLVVVL